MKLGLKVIGSIAREVQRARDDLAAALHWGLEQTGDELKQALRADVRANLKSRRLPTTWRGGVYPDSPRTGTLRPAYWVGNKVPYIVNTFERGAAIKARRAAALVVPIGAGRRMRPGREGRAALVKIAERRFGKLIARRNRRTNEVLLGYLATSANGRSRFRALFLLRRQVQAPDLLDADGIIRRFDARWRGDFRTRWVGRFEVLHERAASAPTNRVTGRRRR